MARDLSADIDRLTEQLADLRSILSKQASDSAENAYGYLAPKARQVARQFRHDGRGIAAAARGNPTAATGAVLGALAIGAVIGLLLSGGHEKE